MRTRIVVGVIVVGLLVGGAALTDVALREEAEQRLAGELQQQIAGLETEPEVTIDGFPFLTQVLARELDAVHVTAPSATVEGLRLDQVDVWLNGVSTDRPSTAQHARMTAVVSVAALQDVLAVPAELSIEGDSLVASTELLGVPVQVLLVPRAAGRAIDVEIDGFRMGGATIAAQDLPAVVTEQLQGLSFPVESLPQGIELTVVRIETDGIHLQAEGTDVVLDGQELG